MLISEDKVGRLPLQALATSNATAHLNYAVEDLEKWSDRLGVRQNILLSTRWSEWDRLRENIIVTRSMYGIASFNYMRDEQSQVCEYHCHCT